MSTMGNQKHMNDVPMTEHGSSMMSNMFSTKSLVLVSLGLCTVIIAAFPGCAPGLRLVKNRVYAVKEVDSDGGIMLPSPSFSREYPPIKVKYFRSSCQSRIEMAYILLSRGWNRT